MPYLTGQIKLCRTNQNTFFLHDVSSKVYTKHFVITVQPSSPMDSVPSRCRQKTAVNARLHRDTFATKKSDAWSRLPICAKPCDKTSNHSNRITHYNHRFSSYMFQSWISKQHFQLRPKVATNIVFVPGTTISLRSHNRSHAKCRIELLGFFGKMFSARKKLCYDIRDEI